MAPVWEAQQGAQLQPLTSRACLGLLPLITFNLAVSLSLHRPPDCELCRWTCGGVCQEWLSPSSIPLTWSCSLLLSASKLPHLLAALLLFLFWDCVLLSSEPSRIIPLGSSDTNDQCKVSISNTNSSLWGIGSLPQLLHIHPFCFGIWLLAPLFHGWPLPMQSENPLPVMMHSLGTLTLTYLWHLASLCLRTPLSPETLLSLVFLLCFEDHLFPCLLLTPPVKPPPVETA